MEEVLGFINKALEDAGVSYEFLEWTQKVTYPYFVGEYSEFEPENESGEEDKTWCGIKKVDSLFSRIS